MSDGGTVSIDWAYPPDAQEDQDSENTIRKVCIVFPGLSGNSSKGYVSSLVRHLSQECGYIVGVFHNRGVAQEYTSPAFPDITSSEEIDKCLKHMQAKFPND
jgi:predicted alpha/beta-fold hydrolase